MFEMLKDAALTIALNKVKDKVFDQYLDGIGRIDEIAYKNKILYLRVLLEGLEQPIALECSDICVSADGSTVVVHKCRANLKFVQTLLERLVTGRSFAVPEGPARIALAGAKKVLGL